jgi:hypothetical protein
MSVSFEFVFLGRGFSDGLITRPKELYRVWCVSMIIKPRKWRGPGPLGGCRDIKKNWRIFVPVSYMIDEIYFLNFVGIDVGHQVQPKKINREVSENSLRKQKCGGQNNTERVPRNKFFTMQ